MSNFESGPALKKHDGEVIRWEDAAEPVTVQGWKCKKCGHFYGDNERAARYCCHTDAPCECGARKDRHNVKCAECWHKQKIERWTALKQAGDSEPTHDAPWALYDGDTYFFDVDSFIEHCDEHQVKPSEVFPILCQEHNPGAFSLSEWLNDYLPGEESEMVGEPEEWRAVEKAVNDFVDKYAPLSWMPDHKRRPTDAALAALDKEYADYLASNRIIPPEEAEAMGSADHERESEMRGESREERMGGPQ